MPSDRGARDEDPDGSLVDMLTLLSRVCFAFVLIAFSSSPLTISPSDRGDWLILAICRMQEPTTLLRCVWENALAYLLLQKVCALVRRSRTGADGIPHRSDALQDCVECSIPVVIVVCNLGGRINEIDV